MQEMLFYIEKRFIYSTKGNGIMCADLKHLTEKRKPRLHVPNQTARTIILKYTVI